MILGLSGDGQQAVPLRSGPFMQLVGGAVLRHGRKINFFFWVMWGSILIKNLLLLSLALAFIESWTLVQAES